MATIHPTRRRNRTAESSRSARLEARITTAQKAMIERAAAYEGRTLSDFVVSTLASAAEAVIHDHEIIQLNQAQSRAFVECLIDPPAANPALKKAARKYRRMIDTQ